MDYNELYQLALEFLLSKNRVTEELIEKHSMPLLEKPKDMKALYQRFCMTAQNRGMSNNVIGNSIGGIENLGKVLFDFQIQQVIKKYRKEDYYKLYNEIGRVLKPIGKFRNTSRSLWPQFSKSVIEGAWYLANFKNAIEFYKWVDLFVDDQRTKPALPLLLSTEISGIGFALACDFIKEIGYTNFSKPDVHIKYIFEHLGLIDKGENELKKDIDTLRLIDDMAREIGETQFAIDKVFWLIGSGSFYLIEDFTIGENREEFVKLVKKDARFKKDGIKPKKLRVRKRDIPKKSEINRNTLEYHAGKTSRVLQEYLKNFRESVFKLDNQITEHYTGSYISINKGVAFIGIYILECKFYIRMRINSDKLKDINNVSHELNFSGWSFNREIIVEEKTNITQVIGFVKQLYNNQVFNVKF